MSEMQQTDQPIAVNPMKDDGDRPWHGTDNPLEALYLHFTAEIAALKAKWAPKQEPAPPSDPQAAYQAPAVAAADHTGA